MKIAVNTRLLLPNQLEGLGIYTHELFSRMVDKHPECEFHFIFDRPYSSEFIYRPNVKAHWIYPPVKSPLLGSIWYDFSLNILLKRIKVDVFFSPDSIAPRKPVCPQVLALHDLNFMDEASSGNTKWQRFYRDRTSESVANSLIVVTVSEFSKKDIVEKLRIPEEKIVVIYNGVSSQFGPVSEAKQKEIRESLTGGSPYFIFVGGYYKRKNLLNQIKAFETFKGRTQSNMKFVLIGNSQSDDDGVLDHMAKSKYKEDFLKIGRMGSREELNDVLASAEALMYVSHLEGFGLPLVEALKSGIPVLTSNQSSLPEIGGKAALYADPQNFESIVNGMIEIQKEDVKRELLLQAPEQLKAFDWDKSAEDLFQLLKKSVDH